MNNLKRARTIKMLMKNLPENPWFVYYKLKRYGNSVLWSNVPKGRMQYQAENFLLTDDEFDGLVRDNRIKALNKAVQS